MRKIAIILSLFALSTSSCGQRQPATLAVTDNTYEEYAVVDAGEEYFTETCEEYLARTHRLIQVGSGVVRLEVPAYYYELIVPYVDTIYFNSFDPTPVYWEDCSCGDEDYEVEEYEHHRHRSWLSQFLPEATPVEHQGLVLATGMGFVISDNGKIVTSAHLFTPTEVDTEAVREFYMEYIAWRISNNIDGEDDFGRKVDMAKLAKVRACDVQIRRKRLESDVAVRFFHKTQYDPQDCHANHALILRRNDEAYNAKLIGYDEHIAVIQLIPTTYVLQHPVKAKPQDTHVFDTTAKAKPIVGETVRLLGDAQEDYMGLLQTRISHHVSFQSPVAEMDNTTMIFSLSNNLQRVGAPFIDSLYNLVGMNIYTGKFGFTSHGIATEEINKRIKQILEKGQ